MNVKQVLIVEGSVNLLISLSKLGVGLMTNSSVIIADALHSLSDAANNVIAWMAVKIAQTPADKNHPYGHQKFEQLAVFGLATLLCIVAFEVLLGAFERFGHVVEQSFIGLVILIGTLTLNIGLMLWEGYWAKRLDSDILHADASHTLSDVVSSIVVIVGWQLASLGYYWLDAVFAIALSGIVFYLAFKLFQRAIPILVDWSDLDPTKISQVLASLDYVKGVRRVRSRTHSKGRTADVIIAVEPTLSTVDSHLIADDIEKILADKFNIHDATVHIEPFEDTTK
jgi:cation diffusion facilitator family transporter